MGLQIEAKHKIYSDIKHVGQKVASTNSYVLYISGTKINVNYI